MANAVLRTTLTVIASGLMAHPAFALDAITYSGTLGGLGVVVELAADASGKTVGRYAYLSQGIDIPLDAAPSNSAAIDLNEELPCTPALCLYPDGELTLTPPLGAHWHLEKSATGDALTGTWEPALGGKILPVALTRSGTRQFEPTSELSPASLIEIEYELWPGSAATDWSQTSPFDAIRLQIIATLGPETHWGDVAFRPVIDPRTKFAFPRITQLRGINPAAANAALDFRHMQINLAALSCAAQQYLPFGWNESVATSAGSLGGYEDETIEVTYLSPTLMSWTESGSTYCGGAHPDNHSNAYTLDVARGVPFDPSPILKAWLPHPYGSPDDTVPLETARQTLTDYAWAPDAELLEFIKAHRKIDDPQFDTDCGINDLLGEYLAVHFIKDDQIAFTLQSLPNAIVACGGDVLVLPIGEIKQFLTPTAADYFPSLKN